MCRYGFHRYREHYACFACRRGFKIDRGSTAVLCPACRTPMKPLGKDCKVPSARALNQWRKIELFVQVGISIGLGHCGCGGPGYRPGTLAEARQFVTKYRTR
jgi:LSD1 subclass zinc finger protein